MFNREVSHRIFAAELKESTKFERDPKVEKSPGFLITNLGAMVNRCLLVGMLVEVDNVGKDEPYYRGRIIDPTGNILIYAGHYAPEAALALEKMPIPSNVLVIGKTTLYRPEDGGAPTVSVRAESVLLTDEDTRRRWVLEAGKSLLVRAGGENEHYKKIARDALASLLPAAGEKENQGKWTGGKNGPAED
jgi:RPA family protein